MPRMLKWLIFSLLLGISLNAIALKEDQKQPVNIIGDEATFNYKTGVKVFTGHVKVDQGTTHITADRLVTKNDQARKIAEAIAYGVDEPAHYWTLPKMGEPIMHARAKIITFYPILSKVRLEQNAIVTQGDNSFQGQLILYDMKEETITVPPTKGGRAVLIYNPDT